MKRNLAVLVLLVMWSLLSVASLSSASTTGALPEKQGSSEVSSPDDDIVIYLNGGGDDDEEGDPGDLGDGYGVADQPDGNGGLGGLQGAGDSILDELLLLLSSLIQLAL